MCLHTLMTTMRTRIHRSLLLVVALAASPAFVRSPERGSVKKPWPLWNANYRACFPDVVNTPDTYKLPPSIDGTLGSDNGWTNAWRYVFNNGTTPDVIVQGIKDNTNIYLSIEVNNDLQFNVEDLIIVGISPTGNLADDRMLQISPVAPGIIPPSGGGGGTNPTSVKYWLGSSATAPRWTGQGGVPPAGTQVAVSTSQGGGTVSWFVEVTIPRGAYAIPVGGDFGFYFNVIPVNGPTTGPLGTASEFPWPLGTPIGLDVIGDVPASSTWGHATVAGLTCNGVSISSGDIFTNNSPPLRIATNITNVFNAVVHNNSIDGFGNPIAAQSVDATFKIANFGLSNHWTLVQADPGTTNPTTAANIAANSTKTYTMNWTLNATEVPTYSTPATDHQCILVELNASGPAGTTTVLTNKSAWINMDIGTASEFTSIATIDGRDWGHLMRNRTRQLFDLVISRVDTFLQQGDMKPTVTAPARVSQITYLVHGCLHTGQQIVIRKKTFDVCQRIGSFGYMVRHPSQSKASWNVRFTGPGLGEPMGPGKNVRQIAVAPDSIVRLTANFVAQEGGGGGRPRRCLGLSTMGTLGLVAGMLLLGVPVYRRSRSED